MSKQEDLYLGFDLSTQKLKMCIVNESLEPIHDLEVNFDEDLKEYHTKGGAISGQSLKGDDQKFGSNGCRISCPTMMWVKALDLVLKKAVDSNVNFGAIKSISGCAQQHGSVFWKRDINKLREAPSLDSSISFAQQMQSEFSRQFSPIWMDSSTSSECDELATAVGSYTCTLLSHDVKTIKHDIIKGIGEQILIAVTGSQAQERFTLPQILKINHEEPEIFAMTGKITLVSNFLATLLVYPRLYVPIDYTEASGINLMDLSSKAWSPLIINALLKQTSYPINKIVEKLSITEMREDLILPQPNDLSLDAGFHDLNYLLPSPTFVTTVSDYLISKYKFDPKTRVTAFMGDNAATLVGSRATSKDLLISLGTSDTAFFWTKIAPVQARLEVIVNEALASNGVSKIPGPIDRTHIFANPISPFHDYLALVCYTNGSLTRERVLKEALLNWGQSDPKTDDVWSAFDQAIARSTPGNQGLLGFYYTTPENTPKIGSQVHGSTGWVPCIKRYDAENKPVEAKNVNFDQEARALIEGRFLAMLNHVAAVCEKEYSSLGEKSKGEWVSGEKSIIRSKFEKIIVSGGAANNRAILQIMANIFGLPVHICATADGKGRSYREDKARDKNGKKTPQDLKELLAEQGQKPISNTAALGSAYMAKFALVLDQKLKAETLTKSSRLNSQDIPYEAIFRGMTSYLQGPVLVAEPDLKLTEAVYEPLAKRYQNLEADLIYNLNCT